MDSQSIETPDPVDETSGNGNGVCLIQERPISDNELINVDEGQNSKDDDGLILDNLAMRMATRQELLEQIKLESILLQTVELKIEDFWNTNKIKMVNREVVIILSNRINKLYEIVFKNCLFDENIINEYIKFGFYNKYLAAKCILVIDGLMQMFHNDPNIYIACARFAFKDCKRVETARKYLTKGLKHHRYNKTIFLETFRIEIQHLNSSEEVSPQQVVDTYQYIIKHFENDIDFHFNMVDTALNFSIGEIQHIVVRDMVNKYRKNELMWYKLAKIHNEGYTYDYDTELLFYHKDDKLVYIRNCLGTLEKALLENMLPINKQELWYIYLDTMISLSQSQHMKDEKIKDYVNNKIELVFQQAYDNDALNKPDYFIFWAENSNNSKLEILEKSVIKIQNSPELWEMLFGYFVFQDYYEKVKEIFNKATIVLKDNSINIWRAMELYVLNTNDKTITDFYEQSVNSPDKEISSVFKPEYLSWCLLKYGIERARELFIKIKILEPKCLKLYQKMIYFESLQCISSRRRQINIMRRLHNEACNTFGHASLEVWVDCLTFEYEMGESSFTDTIIEGSAQLLDPNLQKTLLVIREKLDKEFKFKKVEIEIIEIEDD